MINPLEDFAAETRFFGTSVIQTYTLLVQAGRLILLLTLVGFLAILVAFPLFWTGQRPSSEVMSQKYQTFSLDNNLHDATFLSSHGNSPYKVGAQHAENLDDNRVVLQALKSTLHEKARDIHVVSQKGLYDRSGEDLVLEKDVKLTTTDGYVVTAPSAMVDLKTKDLSGKEGVKGEGPLGALQAPEFAIRDNGNEIVLTGPSSLVISVK